MVKNSTASARDIRQRVRSLGWEDPLGVGKGNPLQYSCLENLMDRGAWQAMVHRVTVDIIEVTQHAYTKNAEI